MNAYTQFIISGVILILVGTKLTQLGDSIARKTGLGGLWIGAALMALATSLPELVADVSASLIGAVNLALGDILGSGMSNMLILAIVNLLSFRLYQRIAISRKVAFAHTLTATLAMLLTALVAVFISLRLHFQILRVGVDTILLAIVYFLGFWFLSREQREVMISIPAPEEEKAEIPATETASLARSLVKFAIGAAVIVLATPYMVSSAQEIAIITGLGTTFVGTLFLAAVTSFPELVVSISAVRIRAFDLAVGNLFGSNSMNILIIFFSDIAFRGGALLSSVSPAHIVTILFLLLIMGIGIAGISFRARKKYLLLVPVSVLMMILYVVGMYVLLLVSAGK